jgi:hypothetical protein
MNGTGQGRRISTSSDFAHTAVLMYPGEQGTVYKIVFDNWEYPEGEKANWALFASLAFFTVAILLVFPVIAIGQGIGVPWFVSLAVWIGFMVFVFNKVKVPWSIKRTIEIDMGNDSLRVLNKTKVEQQHRLSSLVRVTVEYHPDAELVRSNRMAEGKKQLRHEELQHCLMGWFGIGGSRQVMLLARVEPSKIKTLFEVQQAIYWAWDLGKKARGQKEGTESGDQRAPEGDGIKPPLD